MLSFFCGPSVCDAGGWLYDFQNFIAGVLALLAGVGAYFAGRAGARATEKASADQIAAATAIRDQDANATVANVHFSYATQFNALCRALDGINFDDGVLSAMDMRTGLAAPVTNARHVSHQCWGALRTVPLSIAKPTLRGLIAFDEFVTAVEIFRVGGHKNGLLANGYELHSDVDQSRERYRELIRELFKAAPGRGEQSSTSDR